jgi:hypothetical protein
MRTTETVVTCVDVLISKYQKLQAELRQVITTFYPSQGVNAGHDSLFDFSGDETPYESTKVIWMNVPEGTTPADVSAMLKKFPNSRIQRILSHKPMLEEGDIANSVTLEDKSLTQVVRNSEGQIVLKNGKPQYRRYFFKKEAVADVDLRSETADSPFIPEWMKAELGLASGQAIATSPATIEEDDLPEFQTGG